MTDQPSNPALYQLALTATIVHEQEIFMQDNKVMIRRTGSNAFLVRSSHKTLTRNQLLYCVYGFLERET